MKNIILITASALCTLSTTAQNVTSEVCRKLNNNTYCISTKNGETNITQNGKNMPGAVVFDVAPVNPPSTSTQTINPQPTVEQKYCIETTAWKNVVKNNGEIVSGNVLLRGGATLTDAGVVVWSDKSLTILKNGACIDESGTIFGSSKITAMVTYKSKSVPKPKLDEVVNNYSFFPPR